MALAEIPLVLALLAAALAVNVVCWRRRDRRAAQVEAEVARLRAIVDAAPVALWAQDAAGRTIDGNAMFRRLGGDQPSSALATVARVLAHRVAASGVQQIDSRPIVDGGRPRLMALTVDPVSDGLQVGNAVDHSTIEALQAEIARYIEATEALFADVAVAVAVFGGDQRLRFANPAFVRLWPLDPAWVERQPSLGEILDQLRAQRRLPDQADHPAYRARLTRQFENLIGAAEELLYLPDGATLRSRFRPHQAGGLVWTIEDVTDRLALERSYNTLIAVQRETLDTLSDAVAVFGTDGRLRLRNPALSGLWGLPADWLDTRPPLGAVVEHLHALDVGPGHRTPLAALTEGMSAREAADGHLRRGDGTLVQWRRTPLADGSTMFVFHDASAREQVERALRERAQGLEMAERLRSEFLAGLGHELRTPLTTILGYIELLDAGYLGDLNLSQAAGVNAGLAAAQQLRDLLDDMLDLASIEGHAIGLDIAPVDVGALIQSVVAGLRDRPAAPATEITVDIARDLPTIRADHARLRQVLLALLNNSLSFTPAGGHIAVEARTTSAGMTITIVDSGLPVGADDLVRSSSRFLPRSRIGRRTAGMSLMLARNLLGLHGGRLEPVIDPRAGAGQRFICHLPVRATPTQFDQDPRAAG
jgi:signal transduction histidine kinase